MLRAPARARPYSDDLRRKLSEAFDQGKDSSVLPLRHLYAKSLGDLRFVYVRKEFV